MNSLSRYSAALVMALAATATVSAPALAQDSMAAPGSGKMACPMSMSCPKLSLMMDNWVGYDGYGALGVPKTVSPWPGGWGFKVRRVNIGLSGKVGKHLGYQVLVDPTYAGVLKNAVGYYETGWFRFDMGQMKVPYSTEALTAPQDLLTVERSAWATSAETGRFGFRRDLGADVVFGPKMAKLLLGVFDGAQQNIGPAAILNNNKDYVARLTLDPLDNLKIAASYLNGAEAGLLAGTTGNFSGPVAFTRREDLSLALDLSQWSVPVVLSGEVLSGDDGGQAQDTELGYDAQAGYNLNARNQLVLKYEGWNPNTLATGSASVAQSTVTLGWNLFPVKGHEVQIDYSHDFLAKGSDDRVMANYRFFL